MWSFKHLSVDYSARILRRLPEPVPQGPDGQPRYASGFSLDQQGIQQLLWMKRTARSKKEAFFCVVQQASIEMR